MGRNYFVKINFGVMLSTSHLVLCLFLLLFFYYRTGQKAGKALDIGGSDDPTPLPPHPHPAN